MLHPAAAETDDLRSTIEAQFNETPAESPAPEVEAPETPEVVETPEAEVTDNKGDHPTDERRYADGTFKPTKTEAAPDKAAPVETRNSPSKDDQTKASAPASTPTDAPPAGWTAEAKAEWPNLSAAVKAASLKREAEIAKGGQQWSDEKRRYETILAPVAEASRSRGLDVGQGIQLLISAQNQLDANPINGIRRIMATYGVTPEQLAGTAADSSRETQPDISALVRQAVAPMLAPLQDRFAAEERQRQQTTVDLVTQFAASPGHEHFDAVQDELMAMIPQIKAANPTWAHEKVLQDAYDRAVYANPTTRAAVLAAQQAETEAKRQADAKARADKARRAASSVTGAPSGSPSTQGQDSLRAEIEAAFAGG